MVIIKEDLSCLFFAERISRVSGVENYFYMIRGSGRGGEEGAAARIRKGRNARLRAPTAEARVTQWRSNDKIDADSPRMCHDFIIKKKEEEEILLFLISIESKADIFAAPPPPVIQRIRKGRCVCKSCEKECESHV